MANFNSCGICYDDGAITLNHKERNMSMMSEFRDFAMRGNVVDMAVGIVIGGAFGMALGGVDFSDLAMTLKEASGDIAAVTLNYGAFIQTVIDFIIIAFAIFMVIKAMNNLKKKEEEAPAAPPKPSAEETLLAEIRDLLRKDQ
jgi:large conductance mechanosensitive channel